MMTKERMTTRSALGRSAMLLALALLAGCAAEVLPDDGEVVGTSQELAFVPGRVISTDVPVIACYRRGSGVSAADFSTAVSNVSAALDATWAAASGLRFDHDSSCTSAEADANLEITVSSGNANSGVCSFGLPAKCTVGVSGSAAELQRVAVHEVGHGLGIPHEHQRTDAPTLCASELKRLQDAQARIAAGMAQPNDQFIVDNRVPDPSFRFVTPYDPYSIMNYCGDASQGGPRAAGDFSLSSNDALGISILYPRDLGARFVGGFDVSGRRVVRSNDTLIPEWTALGVSSGAFMSSRVWEYDGTYRFASSLPVSNLPYSSTQVSLTFTGPNGEVFSGSQQVEINHSLHTAILMATM